MPAWNGNDIRKQWQRTEASGWTAHFHKAAADYDVPSSLLMAIASRETNMRNIVGDGGRGYGIMQIDVGSFPDWCHSGLWRNVEAAILKGAQVLDMKREAIRLGQGKKLSVGGKSFTGKALDDGALLRVAVAAYNCGSWAYYNVSTNKDVDATTTGKDYSADTFRRKATFDALIG